MSPKEIRVYGRRFRDSHFGMNEEEFSKFVTNTIWAIFLFLLLIVCCYTWFQIGRYVESHAEEVPNVSN